MELLELNEQRRGDVLGQEGIEDGDCCEAEGDTRQRRRYPVRFSAACPTEISTSVVSLRVLHSP